MVRPPSVVLSTGCPWAVVPFPSLPWQRLVGRSYSMSIRAVLHPCHRLFCRCTVCACIVGALLMNELGERALVSCGRPAQCARRHAEGLSIVMALRVAPGQVQEAERLVMDGYTLYARGEVPCPTWVLCRMRGARSRGRVFASIVATSTRVGSASRARARAWPLERWAPIAVARHERRPLAGFRAPTPLPPG